MAVLHGRRAGPPVRPPRVGGQARRPAGDPRPRGSSCCTSASTCPASTCSRSAASRACTRSRCAARAGEVTAVDARDRERRQDDRALRVVRRARRPSSLPTSSDPERADDAAGGRRLPPRRRPLPPRRPGRAPPAARPLGRARAHARHALRAGPATPTASTRSAAGRTRSRRYAEGGRADPFSGMHDHAKWLTARRHRRGAARLRASTTVDVAEQRDERNGPRVLLFAER